MQETIKLLQQGLTNHISNLEMSNKLTMATFLHPKFKQYALSKTVGEQTKTRLVNAVAQHINNTTQTLPSVSTSSINEKKG